MINKVYKLLKDNERLLIQRIYPWLREMYNIRDEQEMFNIILLAATCYPCNIEYCIKSGHLSKLVYLKETINKYLAFKEGSNIAKYRYSKYTMKYSELDELSLNKYSYTFDTDKADEMLYKRALMKLIRSTRMGRKYKIGLFLKFTTDYTVQQIADKVGLTKGALQNGNNRFIDRIKRKPELLNEIRDFLE